MDGFPRHDARVSFFEPQPEVQHDQGLVDAYTIDMLRRLVALRESQLAALRRRVQQLEWDIVLLGRRACG